MYSWCLCWKLKSVSLSFSPSTPSPSLLKLLREAFRAFRFIFKVTLTANMENDNNQTPIKRYTRGKHDEFIISRVLLHVMQSLAFLVSFSFHMDPSCAFDVIKVWKPQNRWLYACLTKLQSLLLTLHQHLVPSDCPQYAFDRKWNFIKPFIFCAIWIEPIMPLYKVNV